jgi:hypothetical protein
LGIHTIKSRERKGEGEVAVRGRSDFNSVQDAIAGAIFAHLPKTTKELRKIYEVIVFNHWISDSKE